MFKSDILLDNFVEMIYNILIASERNRGVCVSPLFILIIAAAVLFIAAAARTISLLGGKEKDKFPGDEGKDKLPGENLHPVLSKLIPFTAGFFSTAFFFIISLLISEIAALILIIIWVILSSALASNMGKLGIPGISSAIRVQYWLGAVAFFAAGVLILPSIINRLSFWLALEAAVSGYVMGAASVIMLTISAIINYIERQK